MIKRLTLFFVWGFLGMVLSYGVIYALSPFGLALIAFVAVVALVVPAVDGSRWPEAVGFAAGPGAFCLLIAATSDVDVAAFAAVGAAIICAAAATYFLVGRARCADCA